MAFPKGERDSHSPPLSGCFIADVEDMAVNFPLLIAVPWRASTDKQIIEQTTEGGPGLQRCHFYGYRGLASLV